MSTTTHQVSRQKVTDALAWLCSQNQLFVSVQFDPMDVHFNRSVVAVYPILPKAPVPALFKPHSNIEYGAFVWAYFYPVDSLQRQLVRVPLDIGSSSPQAIRDLDFDEWLDIAPDNVLDLSDYITIVSGLDSALPHPFAVLVAPPNALEPLNQCANRRLGVLHFGTLLVVAMDSAGSVSDVSNADEPWIDRVAAAQKHVFSGLALTRMTTLIFPDDVVFCLLLHCSIATGTTFSLASHTTRSLFLVYLDARVRACLSHFVVNSSHDPFIRLLHDTGSGIAGSFATRIVNIKADMPRDLNMLISRGHLDSWQVFLTGLGGTRIANAHCLSRFRQHLTTFVVYDMPTVRGYRRRITLSVAKGSSLLLPLVASELTSQMCLVTASHIICCYPQLTISGKASLCWVRDPAHRSNFRCGGFDIKPSTAMLGSPCGLECPYIWRRTFGFAGIADVAWPGSHPHLVPANALRNEDVRWRLGRTCYNSLCPNFYGVRN
ncbi:hypothetical protein C8J57DRAFT_1506076 [Mycena rebaudengoi]|nr:hypothetical protein C8J57DRAFT_1506076 [Mycena rebaudengoi]